LIFVIFLSCSLLVAFDQEPEQQPEAGQGFVSGTVTYYSSAKIVVNRAVLGKPPEERTFLITPETKIEGRPRVNARVTVGFRPTEAGDVAVRIIVRPTQGARRY
jgi:hypothetical protein